MSTNNDIYFDTDIGTVFFKNTGNMEVLTYEKLHDRLNIQIPLEQVILLPKDSASPRVVSKCCEKYISCPHLRLNQKQYRIDSIQTILNERVELVNLAQQIYDLVKAADVKVEIPALCQLLKQRFSEMGAQSLQLRNELDRAKRENEDLRQANKKLQDEQRLVEEQKAQLSEQLKSQEQELQEQKNLCASFEIQAKDDRENWEREQNSLIKQLQDLQRQFNQISAEKTQLNEQYRELYNQYQLNCNQSNNIQMTYLQLQMQYSKLNSEKESLFKQLKQAKDEIEALSSNDQASVTRRLKNQIEALEFDLKNRKNKIEGLEEQIDQLEKQAKKKTIASSTDNFVDSIDKINLVIEYFLQHQRVLL